MHWSFWERNSLRWIRCVWRWRGCKVWSIHNARRQSRSLAPYQTHLSGTFKVLALFRIFRLVYWFDKIWYFGGWVSGGEEGARSLYFYCYKKAIVATFFMNSTIICDPNPMHYEFWWEIGKKQFFFCHAVNLILLNATKISHLYFYSVLYVY